MLRFDALRAGKVSARPFVFFQAQGALTRDDAARVRADYPLIRDNGFLPLSKLKGGPAFDALIQDLQSTELAAVLSEKLGLDLAAKPRMITVRRLSKASDGRIHNDSEAKICTMLVYLNDAWDAALGGAVRALNGPADMADYAAEVAPLYGNVFAFARSETSWHGHPPFSGERFVVQTTFLRSDADLDRKESRGFAQMLLKRLNPFSNM